MNVMNDQNFFDLAMKAIARQATDAELAELDGLLASQPDRKIEFERLQADVRTAKETLALAHATAATTPELPGYVRGRLRTKVQQTLRPSSKPVEPAGIGQMLRKWWIAAAATGAMAAAVIFLAAFPQSSRPMIQVAMLDTAGTVRGSTGDDAAILKNQWNNSSIQNFDSTAPLGNWETNWPQGDKVVAKVVYDRAAAEVRVSLHGRGNPKQRTFVIERDLAATLQEVNAFIQEQAKR
jgi:hypothetical protein